MATLLYFIPDQQVLVVDHRSYAADNPESTSDDTVKMELSLAKLWKIIQYKIMHIRLSYNKVQQDYFLLLDSIWVHQHALCMLVCGQGSGGVGLHFFHPFFFKNNFWDFLIDSLVTNLSRRALLSSHVISQTK